VEKVFQAVSNYESEWVLKRKQQEQERKKQLEQQEPVNLDPATSSWSGATHATNTAQAQTLPSPPSLRDEQPSTPIARKSSSPPSARDTNKKVPRRDKHSRSNGLDPSMPSQSRRAGSDKQSFASKKEKTKTNSRTTRISSPPPVSIRAEEQPQKEGKEHEPPGDFSSTVSPALTWAALFKQGPPTNTSTSPSCLDKECSSISVASRSGHLDGPEPKEQQSNHGDVRAKETLGQKEIAGEDPKASLGAPVDSDLTRTNYSPSLPSYLQSAGSESRSDLSFSFGTYQPADRRESAKILIPGIDVESLDPNEIRFGDFALNRSHLPVRENPDDESSQSQLDKDLLNNNQHSLVAQQRHESVQVSKEANGNSLEATLGKRDDIIKKTNNTHPSTKLAANKGEDGRSPQSRGANNQEENRYRQSHSPRHPFAGDGLYYPYHHPSLYYPHQIYPQFQSVPQPPSFDYVYYPPYTCICCPLDRHWTGLIIAINHQVIEPTSLHITDIPLWMKKPTVHLK